MSLLLLFQGSGPVTHATSGALAAQGAVLAGSATRFRAHATSGALVGQGSVVAGSSTRFRAHPSSGVLTGQGSEVVGSAERIGPPVTHDASGDIPGSIAVVTGSAARTRQHPSSGSLIGPGSVVVGAAEISGTTTTGGGLYYRGVRVRVKGKDYRIIRRDQLRAIIEREFAEERRVAKQAAKRVEKAVEAVPVLDLTPAMLDEVAEKNVQTLADANSLLLVIDDLLLRAEEEMVMLLMMEAI